MHSKTSRGLLSRRILPALLAIIMAVSLLPMGALSAVAAGSADLEGVAGNNVTGNAQDGYVVARVENANNFVGSSTKVEAFTYEAQMLFSPGGSNIGTLMFGAAGEGAGITQPFFGLELSARQNGEKYDLYLTMFCETAPQTPVYMFMNVLAGTGVSLTDLHSLKVSVSPKKEFSVWVNGNPVAVKFQANFADYYKGGTLGFMTYNTQTTFQNVKYTDEGAFAAADGTLPLAGVTGNNVTGNAQDGYVLERIANSNNFAGSSTSVKAFTYEAKMLIAPGGSNKSTLTFGAPNAGGDMNHPFFGVELYAGQNGDKYDLYLTMFCEKAPANAEWMFTNVLAASGVSLDSPHTVKISVDAVKAFSVSVDGKKVDVKVPASFAEYYTGGHLGFMTYDTQSTFSDVRYSDEGDFGTGFTSNLPGWRGVSGAWTEVPGGYQGSGSGNVFAMSTKAVNSSDPFTYEAKMTLGLDQQAGGIAFGVKDPGNPAGKWICINVDRGGVSRIFSETNAKADWIHDVALTQEQKNKTTYQLKVERAVKDGPLSFYLDGQLIYTKDMPEFAGGYFGLITCNATATFDQVNYTIDGATTGFTSNLTGWTPLNGTWSEVADGYQGVHAGKDTFAYAKDTAITKEDTFIYEADVEIKAGQDAAGILFGVMNPDHPTNDRGEPDHLFCLMAVRGGGSVFAFAHKDGKDEFVNTKAMTDADKAATIYHMRVEYLGSQTANFYINGTLYHSFTLPSFEGGQFGLIVANNTTATFDNVNYYSAVEPKVIGITVEGAQMNEQFDPSLTTYMGSVPYGTASVKITAECPEGLVLTIGGKSAKSGEALDVALGEDMNVIKIVARDVDSGLSAIYTLNIQQMFDEDTIYNQDYRPTFHFTPFRHQMNDPNGLVYNSVTGEYHMFFQCNRSFDSGVGGTTSWGHAVSKDMVNWKELPLAITPDELGVIFSGSGVIDWNNTSGLFEEDPTSPDYTAPGARMVFFYTNTNGFVQSMAYSKDNGRTLIKYANNPVVANPGGVYGPEMRDPCVFWYEDASMENGGVWVMVTVDYRSPHVHLFTSHNLKDWKHSGQVMDIHGAAFGSECPDLYPLALDGDQNNVKWVFRGGGVFYIVGHMEKTGEDTVMFVPETENIRPLNGIADQFPGIPEPELYATQTYSDEPSGRRIGVSWIRERGGNVPGRIWNSAQSLPTENTLRTVNGKPQLFNYPAAEVDAMRDEKILSLKDVQVDESSENVLKDFQSFNCDMDATITLGTATEVGFKLRVGGGRQLKITYNKNDGKLYVDKTTSDGDGAAGVYTPDMTVMDGNKIKLRMLLDQICYDVYGNDGEVGIQGFFYNDLSNAGMEFFSNGTATLDLDVYSMKAMDRTVPDPVVPTVLTDLTLSSALLTPNFSADVTEYTATVANSVGSIKVLPTYTGDAAVTVNGTEVASGAYSVDIALSVGENTITVVAGEKTYTIKVTREEPAPVPTVLTGLALSTGTLAPNFSTEVTEYTATVANSVDSIKVLPTYTGDAAVTVNGTEVASGEYSAGISLSVGENAITVVAGEKTYTIKVTREDKKPPVTETPFLDGLELSQGVLKPSFDKDVNAYTASVGNATDSIQVKPFYSGEMAVTVNGKAVESGVFSEAIALDVGENTIEVKLVMGEKDNIYTIVVTRAKPADTTKPTTTKPSIPGGHSSDWKWPEGTAKPGTGKENPQSGDASALPIALLLMAGAAGTAVFLSRKRKK
ncbi:cadherin-like beta sandwich domain-containing protein [Zongyangia hominis]|uniref:Cadherin-like beta sandwich domain-containing protein n=1 Tax=Zongyangia hominis TaxID=2763677 RepID=A0A926IA75_9FIRM|nr:cadherin-like beta sandwich domain-containing protein [Zongyangia hominis]MBC8569926.1 cadherin-like beta sandwich domain-containing protein [Zongyangia hominis]